jgi:hypothetical protein
MKTFFCKLFKLHQMTLIYDREEATIYECLVCGKVKEECYNFRNVCDEHLYRKH